MPGRKVFISYSHQDKDWCDVLVVILRRDLGPVVDVWSDEELKSGAPVFAKLSEVDSHSVFLLLVSSNYLASVFFCGDEFTPALQEVERRGASIFWVPVGPSAYGLTALSRYKALADPMRPLGVLTAVARRTAYREISEQLSEVLVADDDAVAGTGPDSAFERVRNRSAGAEDELKNAEGGALSEAEFVEQLELDSVDTLRMYHETARVFGWLGRGGEIRYPSWQIHANRLLPGLADVLAVLNEKALSPLSIIGYFLTPRYSLQDARPLDLLRKGEAQLVVEDSKRYGDIGT